MVENIEQTIRTYLPDIIHMSLATSANNKPRVCEVHFVYDDDLNIYFRSKPSRRHSKDIEVNPYVAGNIVKQHILNEKPRGVYFEGKAQMLHDVDENSHIYPLFCDRLDMDEEMLEDAKKEDGHKFYKISVDMYYLFDSKESSPSKKYELKRAK